MELTDNLKKQPEPADAEEETKESVYAAGKPLAQAVLEKVSGGAGGPPSDVFPDDFDFDPFIRDNHILMQYEDARD